MAIPVGLVMVTVLVPTLEVCAVPTCVICPKTSLAEKRQVNMQIDMTKNPTDAKFDFREFRMGKRLRFFIWVFVLEMSFNAIVVRQSCLMGEHKITVARHVINYRILTIHFIIHTSGDDPDYTHTGLEYV